jgi:hypothetical protein
MIPHRYFRASPATYEQMRATLDAAWGLPNDKATTTCMAPLATAPRHQSGDVVIGVLPEWCDWEPAVTLLPQLLASGAVTEITAADYFACLGE